MNDDRGQRPGLTRDDVVHSGALIMYQRRSTSNSTENGSAPELGVNLALPLSFGVGIHVTL